VLVALAAAAPSGAVVGGEPVAPELVPWFADVGGLRGHAGGARPVTTGGRPKDVGHARTYKVTKADASHPLVCTLAASNDGGVSTAPFARTSMVKIPRYSQDSEH
jgi:hypothetical protein